MRDDEEDFKVNAMMLFVLLSDLTSISCRTQLIEDGKVVEFMFQPTISTKILTPLKFAFASLCVNRGRIILI